jgi:chemotaxis protein histidine kinase CheA
MDVNTKVKELEDELKVLKTEIRNVLLDVREVILDRANPLSEQEPAYLRVDLKTTAQAIAAEEAARGAAEAAEEAARAAAKAAEQAKAEEPAQDELEQPEEPAEDELEQPEEPEDSAGDADGLPVEEELGAAEQADEEPEDGASAEPPPEPQAPRRRKRRPHAGPEPGEIPAAYGIYPPLAVGTGSLAAWVAEAMATIGPQQLDRLITIHRLWGYLPPNISQALAHLQELIRCSQEAEPAWLKIMQEMERLSSS